MKIFYLSYFKKNICNKDVYFKQLVLKYLTLITKFNLFIFKYDNIYIYIQKVSHKNPNFIFIL